MTEQQPREINIVSPMASLKEVDPLIDVGANELYCGIQLKETEQGLVVNRRPYAVANLQSLDEFKEAVKRVHARGVKLHLTLNSLYYTPRQYPYLERSIEAFLEARADALIVSDVGLLLLLRDKYPGIRLHLSTTLSAFNIHTVRLFAEELKVKRVILPRHMSETEIINVFKESPVEIEVFLLGQRCINDDGQCTFEHGIGNFCNDGPGQHGKVSETVGCYLNYNYFTAMRGENSAGRKIVEKRYSLPTMAPFFCAFCAMYGFVKAGIRYFKLPGREDPDMQSRIRYLKAAVGVKQMLICFQENRFHFTKEVKKYFMRTFELQCNSSLCYYAMKGNHED